jgi:RNA polymerase sigma-70 factor (ECF subfamily)
MAMMPPVHDEDLIRRTLAGDPLATRALYDRHIDAVFQVAYRLSGDSDIAADYAQETFIRAFRHLSQFRGDSSFSTWIKSIAAKVVFTGERTRSRFVGPTELEGLVDPAPRASEGAFEVRERVHATLEKMSEKLRMAFLLHDVEGYTHVEIAAALEIPVGTSKARLSEARACLRKALAAHVTEQAS